jgi:hypothetical protein
MQGECRCDQPRFLTEPTTSPAPTTQPTTPLATEPDYAKMPHPAIPTLGPNKRSCQLEVVGKPIQHAASQHGLAGAWMRDSAPRDHSWEQKRWVMSGFYSPVLYQYRTEHDLQRKRQQTRFYIEFLSTGTGVLIHNASLYYHQHGTPNIIKYNLVSTSVSKIAIPDVAYRDCARKDDINFAQCRASERSRYLYGLPHNFVDLAGDENGLWAIYHRRDDTALSVTKLRFGTLDIVKTWTVPATSGQTSLANAFVMCGVLYGIARANVYETRIALIYDLFRERLRANTSIRWHNPYRYLTMADYNPRDRRVYFFDKEHMLTVPVKVRH